MCSVYVYACENENSNTDDVLRKNNFINFSVIPAA